MKGIESAHTLYLCTIISPGNLADDMEIGHHRSAKDMSCKDQRHSNSSINRVNFTVRNNYTIDLNINIS